MLTIVPFAIEEIGRGGNVPAGTGRGTGTAGGGVVTGGRCGDGDALDRLGRYVEPELLELWRRLFGTA